MSYRDDQATLEARRDELRAELTRLDAKAADLQNAVNEKETAERELAAIEARLAHAQARRRSPLDDIRIASPCRASWDGMTGDERARFCGDCKKNVYDLSAMTRDEAEHLLTTHEGSLCVRLYRRTDGTVLTADCSVGLRKKRVRLAVISAFGASALAAAAIAQLRTATCTMGEPVMMGAVAPMPRESFVEMKPEHAVQASVVFEYWRDRAGPKQATDYLIVHQDGRAVREISAGGKRVTVSETHLEASELATLLALRGKLRARGTGVVDDYADSAVHEGFDLQGQGRDEATTADLSALRVLGSSVLARVPSK